MVCLPRMDRCRRFAGFRDLRHFCALPAPSTEYLFTPVCWALQPVLICLSEMERAFCAGSNSASLDLGIGGSHLTGCIHHQKHPFAASFRKSARLCPGL